MKNLPKKKWGQNFLTNTDTILDMISALKIKPTDRILEIGPGKGALTEYIIPQAEFVLALEIDQELTQILGKDFGSYDKFKVINKSILDIDISEIKNKYKINKIIGSLPYNISKKIIEKFCTNYDFNFEICIFMLQQEVAFSYLGSKQAKSTLLSVELNNFNLVNLISKVDKYKFFPVPKVESAIIKFRPRRKILIPNTEIQEFIKFTQNCFRNPRKKLAKNLGNIYRSLPWKTILAELSHSENIRIAQLTEQQVLDLYYSFKKLSLNA